MIKTLRQLREMARSRADMTEDSDAVSDDELNEYINEAYHELYDLITVADEARLFAVNAQELPQVGTTHEFALPPNFYRLVSLHVMKAGRYQPGYPADPSSYAELASAGDNLSGYRYFVRWNINTGMRSLFVFPAPTSETLAITYWPTPRELSLDTQMLDNPASWLELVSVGAAIRMLDKVERDATALLLAKRRLEARIQKAVYASDYHRPRVILDSVPTRAFSGVTEW
jgi:hypothetical protein